MPIFDLQVKWVFKEYKIGKLLRDTLKSQVLNIK